MSATQGTTNRSSRLRSDNGQHADAPDESQRALRKRSAEVGECGASPLKRKIPSKPTIKSKDRVISKFFHRNDEDDDDFEVPKKRVQPASKPVAASKVTKPKKTSTIKRSKAKNNIQEKYFSAAVEEHSKRDGVDPEELKLALAISRSMVPEEQADGDEEAPVADTTLTKKQKAVHEIFRRFGLKTGEGDSNTVDLTKRKPRNRWNSKCTLLTRRDPVAQFDRVKARFAKILCLSRRPEINQGTPFPYQVGSEYLAKFYMIQNMFFEANAETNAKELHEFYTNNLCPVSTVAAGILLKDWKLIPGREQSPERQSIVDENREDEISVDSFATARTTVVSQDSVYSLNLDDPNKASQSENSDFVKLNKSSQCGTYGERGSYSDESAQSVVKFDSELNQCNKEVSDILKNPSSPSDSSNIEPQPVEVSTEIDLTQDSFSNLTPTASLVCRSPSPDMFADDDSDVENRVSVPELTLQPPNTPPCSLDPLSSSDSPQSDRQITEEECVIEMYSTGARLMEQLRLQPKAPRGSSDSESDKECCSPEALQIKLNYSGASEVLSSHNNSLQQLDKTEPINTSDSKEKEGEKQPTDKIDVNVYEIDSEEMSEKENICGSYLSQAGIEIFEKFADDGQVKIGEGAPDEPIECIDISDDDWPIDSGSPKTQLPCNVSNLNSTCRLFDESMNLNKALNSSTDEPESPVHISPIPDQSITETDPINFSFDSLASDMDATIPLRESLLKKSFNYRNTTTPTARPDEPNECAIVEDVLEFSFPNEDIHISEILQTRTPPLIQNESISRLKLVDSAKCTKTSPRIIQTEDSIELSDEDFDYSINLSPKQPKTIEPDDESIEISESVLKKSFNYRNTTTPTARADKPNECAIVEDVLEFSFPNEDMHISEILQKRTASPSTQNESISRLKFVDSAKCTKTSPRSRRTEDSIELSDEDFDYSINLSPKQPKTIEPDDESIEISDDEINYSMGHDPLPPINSEISYWSTKNKSLLNKSIANESLQQIFDDDFEVDAELVLNVSEPPQKEDDLVNQSVRSIVHKDFVMNTKPKTPKTSQSSGRTSLWRTKSDVLGITPNRTETKLRVLSPLPATATLEIINDSFDDLIHGLILPSTSLSSSPEKLATVDEHKFTINHEGSEFEIKIGPRCVTPKPNFEAMDTPTRAVQLKKYGLKPLARRKAIICLEHIYNRMHPFVECPVDGLSLADFGVAALRNEAIGASNTDDVSAADVPEESTVSASTFKIYTNKNKTTSSLPQDFLMFLLNEQSDYYLPSAPRSKRAWCLQPLHIAWYNLLRDNPRLFEQVLQYEPLDLKLIRSTLKDIGLLYDPNDLIAFLDKHCITFRTESTRNKKSPSKKSANGSKSTS